VKQIGEDGWRRALGRALSAQADATVAEILAASPKTSARAWRIGLTGAPGAGKSSMLGALALHRLEAGRRLGVLAIDPSSPLSGGSLLGDRVRMDAVADDDRIYIRSMPSGESHDGLCHNIVGMLAKLDEVGFNDIILETVGIGQTSYRAKMLVDTFILTLIPGSGDIIQAMKAGIMELADIYVINKADLPGAEKVAAELRSLVEWRAANDGWRSPIVLTSVRDGRGFAELHEAIERHRTHHLARATDVEASRRSYQLRALLEQRLDEIFATAPDERDLTTTFAAISRAMLEIAPIRAEALADP
jgi:LAO/AO transport system kinase